MRKNTDMFLNDDRVFFYLGKRQLKMNMMRFQELVKINREKGISGMVELNATKEEIRRLNREYYGVTEKDESLAEMAIAGMKSHGDLHVVYSGTLQFIAIIDRLMDYKNVLIFHDNHFAYYGDNLDLIYSILQRNHEMYKEEQYIGSSDILESDYADIINTVSKLTNKKGT